MRRNTVVILTLTVSSVLLAAVFNPCLAQRMFGDEGTLTLVDPPHSVDIPFKISAVGADRLVAAYIYPDSVGFFRLGVQIVDERGNKAFRDNSLCLSSDSTHAWLGSVCTTEDSNCVALYLEWIEDERYVYKLQKINPDGEILYDEGGVVVTELDLRDAEQFSDYGELYPAPDGGCFVICPSERADNRSIFLFDGDGRIDEEWQEDRVQPENDRPFKYEPDGWGGLWTLQGDSLNRILRDGSRMWDNQRQFEHPEEEFNNRILGLHTTSNANLYLLCDNLDGSEIEIIEIDSTTEIVNRELLVEANSIQDWCFDNEDRVYLLFDETVLQYDPNLDDPFPWDEGVELPEFHFWLGEIYSAFKGSNGIAAYVRIGRMGHNERPWDFIICAVVDPEGQLRFGEEYVEVDRPGQFIEELDATSILSGSQWFLWYYENQLSGFQVDARTERMARELIPEARSPWLAANGVTSNGHYQTYWLDRLPSELCVQEIDRHGDRVYDLRGLDLGYIEWRYISVFDTRLLSDRLIVYTVDSYGPQDMTETTLTAFNDEHELIWQHCPGDDNIGGTAIPPYIVDDGNETAIITGGELRGDYTCLGAYNLADGELLWRTEYDPPALNYIRYLGYWHGVGWAIITSGEREQSECHLGVLDLEGELLWGEDYIRLNLSSVIGSYVDEGDLVLFTVFWNDDERVAQLQEFRITQEGEVEEFNDINPFEEPIDRSTAKWRTVKSGNGNLWIQARTFYGDNRLNRIQCLNLDGERLLGENGISLSTSQDFVPDSSGGAWIIWNDEESRLMVVHLDSEGQPFEERWPHEGLPAFIGDGYWLSSAHYDPETNGVFIRASIKDRLTGGSTPLQYRVQLITDDVNGIDLGSAAMPPLTPVLYQTYPNPFNSITTIRYGLPYPSRVSLQVYNLSGQRITTLFEGYRQAGYHTANLTADNLPSGLYFIRLDAGVKVMTQKVMLIK